ncbi:MAG: histidine kinase, partial [Bacteroidales bacterium]|nr:histidine kinase [Bacteroidales bacterium]
PDEDINYWYCLFISGGTAILITTIYEGIDFFRHWKQYIIRAEQIEKANLVAKYETLKKQVHPHFLFNGLNTLIGLIENKDPKASQYAQNLADFLKQLLSLQNQELITLSEELQMVNQYRFIQQVRFNNTLKIKIDVDKALNNKQLPPLAIQMLVENAIKHNITSQSKPLNIQIKNIDSMILEVTNNLQPKKSEHSAKVGLKNMEERYKYITDRKVEIIKNSDSFTVKIPLI